MTHQAHAATGERPLVMYQRRKRVSRPVKDVPTKHENGCETVGISSQGPLTINKGQRLRRGTPIIKILA